MQPLGSTLYLDKDFVPFISPPVSIFCHFMLNLNVLLCFETLKYNVFIAFSWLSSLLPEPSYFNSAKRV